ncbi:4Fe-4S binding protein [Escherichia coli]
MHCVDPNCVCVPGLCAEKDAKTGIVHYDKDVCTGCRYCMVACPIQRAEVRLQQPVWCAA